MRRLQSVAGYTILEAMIFLAITGLLFTSAVVAIGGSQSQAQYSQAVRDFESQIKSVINDVSSGFYPDYTGVVCTRSGDRVSFTSSDASSPGTSSACVNIGKTLLFYLEGADDSFGVGTIVGLSPGLGDRPDLSIEALAPRLAYNVTNPALDMTQLKPIRYGAQVTKIAAVNSPSRTYSSLSFIASFSSDLEATQQNGTLRTDVYAVPGSVQTTREQISFTDIELLATSADRNRPGGYYICLLTNDDKRARVFVGVDGVVTATGVEFDLDSGDICP